LQHLSKKVAIEGLCCHKNSALHFLRSALQEVRPIATIFLKVLLLVNNIAMMAFSCISIDWRCNCLVLLQPNRTVLLLLEIIATVLLGCNISHDHCNR
jgi:hypothetical protein